MRARSLALLACVALLGCDIYDIGPALAALDASQGRELELADRCSEESAPLMESQAESHVVSLDDLADDERTLTGCDGMGIDGPDGFVRLSAAAEQRWSILVEPLEEETDVVLYVLPTCDPSSCTDLLDRCGAGIPESFVFQAPSEGQYLLGIDTRAGAGALEVTVLSTRCGDRRRELGEGCDDGNLMEGDGCDRECRLEIAPDRPREIEPNNWPTEANVVPASAETLERTVTGRLGGACDVDYFVVRLEQPASLGAVLLNGAALPCDESTPAVTMELLNADGTSRRGNGSAGGRGGTCPSIEAGAAFAEDLEAGIYFLRIGAGRDAATVDYNLQIEASPTP
jgi:cysteine-rich repeat protein